MKRLFIFACVSILFDVLACTITPICLSIRYPLDYSVTFYNAVNEKIGNTQKIKKNEDAIEPNEEERFVANYVFYGWDRPYVSIQHDTNVYGLYYSVSQQSGDWIDITFDYQLDSLYQLIYIKKNTLIPEIAVSPVEGKTFDSWCINKECTTPWNFDISKAAESMTLYAKWK